MGIAVALMAFGGCISVALGQDANWDLKNYHIYNAYALLHSRLGYDIAPAQLQSYYNPFLDVPYFLMAVQFQWAPRIVAFLQGTYFGLAAYFLFRIALIVIRQLTGNGKHSIALALVLGLSGAGLGHRRSAQP